VNRDCRLIFEAYTSPGIPKNPAPVANSAVTAPVLQAINKPVGPQSNAIKAEENEKKTKEKTITLTDVDTDRKAIHAAYDIVEAIYRTVDKFDRATQIIQAISSVHRNERKRQGGLKH